MRPPWASTKKRAPPPLALWMLPVEERILCAPDGRAPPTPTEVSDARYEISAVRAGRIKLYVRDLTHLPKDEALTLWNELPVSWIKGRVETAINARAYAQPESVLELMGLLGVAAIPGLLTYTEVYPLKMVPTRSASAVSPARCALHSQWPSRSESGAPSPRRGSAPTRRSHASGSCRRLLATTRRDATRPASRSGSSQDPASARPCFRSRIAMARKPAGASTAFSATTFLHVSRPFRGSSSWKRFPRFAFLVVDPFRALCSSRS